MSSKHSDWGAFGSFVGGIYGALGFFAVAYSIYLTGRQFRKQAEGQIFYKAMESLESRVSNAKITHGSVEFENYSILKLIVSEIKNHLSYSCVYLGRDLLCESPESIDNTQYYKMFQAVLIDFEMSNFENEKKTFIEYITAIEDISTRWESAKTYFGASEHESEALKDALRAIGSVNFYKVKFEERFFCYLGAMNYVEDKFGEFLNGYIKSLNYIFLHIDGSIDKKVYEKFILSQLNKYEIVIMFYYILSCEDSKISELIIKTGVLESISEKECLRLLIDIPSERDIIEDIQHAKMFWLRNKNSRKAQL